MSPARLGTVQIRKTGLNGEALRPGARFIRHISLTRQAPLALRFECDRYVTTFTTFEPCSRRSSGYGTTHEVSSHLVMSRPIFPPRITHRGDLESLPKDTRSWLALSMRGSVDEFELI